MPSSIPIAFYDTKSYDREYFDRENASSGMDMRYHDFRLNAANAGSAEGCKAVCVFVNQEEEGVFFEDHSYTGLQDDVLSRLLTFPNVLITAHQAFLTDEALSAIASVTLDSIRRYCSDQEPVEERVVV